MTKFIKSLMIYTIASMLLFSTSASADIENTARASGKYGTNPIASQDSSQAVAVAPAAPKVRLTKTIEDVSDTNGSNRIDAGDTITYRFDVANTGNLTLTDVLLSDPLINMSNVSMGALNPGASNTSLTGTYQILQSDVNSGAIENSATVVAQPIEDGLGNTRPPINDESDAGDENEETPTATGELDGDPTNDPTVYNITQIIQLDVIKDLVSIEQAFPFVFDLVYEISAINTGNTTVSNLILEDNLTEQLAPATIAQSSIYIESGKFTDSDLDENYDGGLAVANILKPNLSLDPQEEFTLRIATRIYISPTDFSNGELQLNNAVEIDVEQAEEPFPSMFNGLFSPVDVNFRDSDLDGIPDSAESSTEDRDGDGIPDAQDYDPTGYFYCEEDGSIIADGLILVSAVPGGGGNNGAIIIDSDGTNGFFQWWVTAPGLYSMTIITPSGVAPSATRLSGPTINSADYAGQPSIILGSNENANTGNLVDFSAAANPYHLSFDIVAGSPHFFNNNIPFRFCGTPQLELEKNLISGPNYLSNGAIALDYEFNLRNTGNSRAADVGVTDELNSVFGSGNYDIISLAVTSAPSSFSATENTGYNGSTDAELLTSGGYLEPNDEVTIRLSLEVSPDESGTYENIATATGERVVSGDALPSAVATESTFLLLTTISKDLVVIKEAARENVNIGESVDFTITVENTGNSALFGLTLIDALPEGLRYRSGSANIDGVSREPSVSLGDLKWENITIASGQTRTLNITTLVTPSTLPGKTTNKAWIAHPSNGQRISNIGEAEIHVQIDPLFQCSAIIGKVFEDKNLNGYQDAFSSHLLENNFESEEKLLKIQQAFGEPGVGDVKIITPTGTIITTDEFGRFSIPCAETPKGSGTNYSLKVDERSLPEGHQLTTENPRTMRLTAGIFAEMNFGAAQGNVIEIKLNANAFDRDGNIMPHMKDAIGNISNQVEEKHSFVKLEYYYDDESPAEARRRLQQVEAIIRNDWDNRKKKLTISQSIFATE